MSYYPDIPEEVTEAETSITDQIVQSTSITSTATDTDLMDIMNIPQMTQLITTESPDPGK